MNQRPTESFFIHHWIPHYMIPKEMFLSTMDGGKEAGAQVMVQVLVLAHLKHLFPLLYRHLVLDALGRLLLISDLLPTELNT